jgi:hypothetical protein
LLTENFAGGVEADTSDASFRMWRQGFPYAAAKAERFLGWTSQK